MPANTPQPDLCCEICNSSFQRREHYDRHLRTHTKEKPFACTECGQSFGRVDSLSRHHATIHLSADRQDNGERYGERRRVAQACKPCSISKVRCDGERPCKRCHRTNHDCFYEPNSKRNSTISSSHYTPPAKRRKSSNPPPLSPPATDHGINSYDQTPTCHDMGVTRPSPRKAGIGCTAPEDEPPDLTMNYLQFHGNHAEEMPLETDFNPDTLDPRLSIPTPSMFLSDLSENDAWLDNTFDPGFMASLFPHDIPSFESLNKFWVELSEQKQYQSAFMTPPSSGAALDQSAVAELYSRSHSPAVDRDNVELRQYHPTSIELDAQLAFPDFSHLGLDDVDDENLAHVEEVSAEIVDEVSRRADKMQTGPNFPRFIDLKIPPRPVLNAWVQLYFEFFHPVFPILHKPSFTSSRTHWLLMFTVAAIGAHFSSIPDAPSCSRAMHEWIRRQSSIMCEEQNKNSRELWMSQTIVLNHIGMLYAGDRRHLELAEVLQSVPVAVGRRKKLFTNMFPQQKFSQLQLPLTQNWQIWLLDEEHRRAGFAIWLLDSAFRSHFDVGRLMTVGELQISLPCPDDRWGASSAQSWASFPTPQGSAEPITIGRLIVENSWKTGWAKTSTIGRQIILQHLSDIINDRGSEFPGTPCFSHDKRLRAVNTLTNLLVIIENKQSEQALDEIKSSATLQLMALEALMIYNCPTRNLSPTILNFIYDKLDNEAWAQIAEQWSSSDGQGRLACFFAARILEVVRSTHCAHFSTPITLLRAVCVLWTYSILAERFPEIFLTVPASGPVILGPKPLDGMENVDWIEGGWNRVKLPGIGNFLCSQGRCKILDESTMLMRSLKAWGISSAYAQIIARLRGNETPKRDEQYGDCES